MKRVRSTLLGFTLLEVMVATAILGLSLTVILSSQVGLFSSATYAQKMSIAMGLSRCKMSELEETFLKMGYPELDSNDEGPCCNNDARADFSCKWKIERVELPQPDQFGGADGGAGISSMLANPAGSSGLSFGGPTGADPGLLGMLGGMSGGAPLGDGGVPGVTGTSGVAGLMASGGGMNGILSMGMTMVYPSLKPMLEASIRKVTVTVLWKDGSRARELELLQWVTNPSKGGLILGAPPEAASGGPSPTGTGTAPRAPSIDGGIGR